MYSTFNLMRLFLFIAQAPSKKTPSGGDGLFGEHDDDDGDDDIFSFSKPR